MVEQERKQSEAKVVGMNPPDAAAHLCGLMTQGLVGLAKRGSGWVLTAKGINNVETRMAL